MNQKQRIMRERWLARYESLLTEAVPALAGKVDWNTANFLFNRGDTAESAAAHMAQRWHDHDNQEDSRND